MGVLLVTLVVGGLNRVKQSRSHGDESDIPRIDNAVEHDIHMNAVCDRKSFA